MSINIHINARHIKNDSICGVLLVHRYLSLKHIKYKLFASLTHTFLHRNVKTNIIRFGKLSIQYGMYKITTPFIPLTLC